jgi:hypothetical protein
MTALEIETFNNSSGKDDNNGSDNSNKGSGNSGKGSGSDDDDDYGTPEPGDDNGGDD